MAAVLSDAERQSFLEDLKNEYDTGKEVIGKILDETLGENSPAAKAFGDMTRGIGSGDSALN